MYVAPNSVSGRVVKTSIGSTSVGNPTVAPVDRPIQLRCISLIDSGQSIPSRSAISRSAYAVMRSIHWRSGRRNTGKFPRSDRPSAVTSSLDSTVPSPGHQLTGDSCTNARRWASTTWSRSLSVSSAHGRPNGLVPAAGTRLPSSKSAISSSIGRARSASTSYHDPKICRKIHWVQR